MQNYHIIFIIFTVFTDWFIKSIFIIGLTAIITLIGLPILSQDSYRTVENNLVEILKKEEKFNNLVAEIRIAKLTDKLIEQEEFTTLLAFTDKAFEALPENILDKFNENPKKVLEYHLIPGKVTQEDLIRGKIVTIEGHTITVSSHNEKSTVNYTNAKYNHAKSKFPPMPAINGEIIEIDQVLFPPDF